MTDPLHLRLANGWTVTISPSQVAGRVVTCVALSASATAGSIGNWANNAPELVELLREAAALEPPR